MRIGTWNLQGRWDDRHAAHLQEMRCDVLLLTEVSKRVALTGFTIHASVMEMVPGRYWAAVATRLPLSALPDPHGASAMAETDGLRVCSSVLPWRACGTASPWTGSTTAEKTEDATASIVASAPTVWGGDWNHALAGREWSGARRGRGAILEAVEQLGLQVPTVDLPHQIERLLSIDHIAVPEAWSVLDVEHHPALASGARISDHDAYVIGVSG